MFRCHGISGAACRNVAVGREYHSGEMAVGWGLWTSLAENEASTQDLNSSFRRLALVLRPDKALILCPSICGERVSRFATWSSCEGSVFEPSMCRRVGVSHGAFHLKHKPHYPSECKVSGCQGFVRRFARRQVYSLRKS